jgi:hypothetical protein
LILGPTQIYECNRGTYSCDSLDDLIGGITLVFWSRVKAWAERIRIQTGTPKSFEWCEWLAEQITERRVKLGHEAASVRHAGWQE